MELSVVIPAYNEEQRLPRALAEVLDYMEERGQTYEVIVVNDGSSDGTAAVVEEIQKSNQNVRLLSLEQNSGKGCAIRNGVQHAGGDRVLFADADGSTPIAELEKLEAALEAGGHVAIGSRAVPSAETNTNTVWYRKFLGRSFHMCVKFLILPGFYDTQCGFKLFTRDAAQFLFSLQRADGFSFDIEILYLARRAELKVKEVPVNWNIVAGSKVNLIVDSLKMLRDIFIFRLRHRGINAAAFQKFCA